MCVPPPAPPAPFPPAQVAHIHRTCWVTGTKFTGLPVVKSFNSLLPYHSFSTKNCIAIFSKSLILKELLCEKRLKMRLSILFVLICAPYFVCGQTAREIANNPNNFHMFENFGLTKILYTNETKIVNKLTELRANLCVVHIIFKLF